MDIQTGDLPCSANHVRKQFERREVLPDGRVRVSVDLWFIDRRGDEDCVSEQWIEEAAS